MLVDSEYVGDWMASGYTASGVRFDHHLSLRPDGSFRWVIRSSSGEEKVTQGVWRHEREAQLLHFDPGIFESEPGHSLWRILQIPGLEGSNTFMILRLVAFASRNLPTLFHRVHLENLG
jgi:hypothetical protein